MIIVDSSVWIDSFNGRTTGQTRKLASLLGVTPLLVGDVILCEVLRGARTEDHARELRLALGRFDQVSMLSPQLAVLAARNYRVLRAAGVTVRKTIDLIIGTYCIEHRCELLHSDRDFDLMRDYLGLRVVGIDHAVHEPQAPSYA